MRYIKIFVTFGFIAIMSIGVYAQKYFGYTKARVAVKLDTRWGALIDHNGRGEIVSNDDNETALVRYKQDSSSFYLPIVLDSILVNAQAIYIVTKTDDLKSYSWTSHTGETQVTRVIFSKRISDLFAWKPEKIRFEIQFSDGSAMNYFVQR